MTTSTTVVDSPHPQASGLMKWLASTDHKQIGILYLLTAFIFFGIGGIEALILRIQLAQPESKVISPEVYDQIFTMHGTTMVFLFAMPILAGFGNYLIPLMIGARDMAFPRLNAFSYWLFLFGGLVLYSSFALGGAPNSGWFAYAPLTIQPYAPTHGMDFWALGILMTGVASTVGSINFIVTILNLRAPGMRFFRLPQFGWQVLITQCLILLALPTLSVAAILLLLERNFGAAFYLSSQGGDPLLWQHLFWFFGHPEVYILILPAFGIISEVVPVFSRKPIFGYNALVFSGIAIGFLGFTVWAHHMFAVGMSPAANAVFSFESMIIAVPTAIKVFNWIGTMWGGKINFKSPMLYAVGFVAMFVIGGFSGITLAVTPIDFQVEDTYYVVAHLHYVLFGGTVFGIFAGVYYWFPKITGRMLHEKLAKIQFWTMFVGFNLTFFPMHILGLLGMPRRIYTYPGGQGWDTLNLIDTIGAFILAVSMIIFTWNFIRSLKKGEPAGNDPWDGHTLEWTISSPPPAINFPVIPTVTDRRPAWVMKYGTKIQPILESPAAVHIPNFSLNPAILALGIAIVAYGIIYTPWLALAGLAIMFTGIIRWVREPR